MGPPPLLLRRGPYEMAEIFRIILEYCSAATTLVPLHISSAMERIIRPSVYLLMKVLKPSEAEFWRDNSDINYVDSAMIRQAMERIVAVLAEIIVYGGQKPSTTQIQHGVSQGARALGFRGRCLVGLLDLQLILLRYCLDAWTCFPPPGQDLWVTRALIIARLWNFIEPEAEFPEYLPGSEAELWIGF
ncbi:hypothetical protein B0H13DRAFT_2382638 [Mycena leptocephala]|nr:hypothetical protein B0H13DRAFT_2382638 [Mycena leptocephala]